MDGDGWRHRFDLCVFFQETEEKNQEREKSKYKIETTLIKMHFFYIENVLLQSLD